MAPRRGRAGRRLLEAAAAALGLAGRGVAADESYTGLGVRVPLKRHVSTGLFVATVEVGTPPQKLEVAIGSACKTLWVPEANSSHDPGFHESKSETAEKTKTKYTQWLNFSDGLNIKGHVVKDTVGFAGLTIEMPIFVGANFSSGPSNGSKKPEPGPGVLGLEGPLAADGVALQPTSDRYSWFDQSDEKVEEGKDLESFFAKFWEQHPEVGKSYRLVLGGTDPCLVIGDASLDGPMEPPGVRLLAETFSKRSNLWYTPVRAIGFSYGGEGKELRWNLDYNSYSEPGAFWGAPALLDTGSAAIRVTGATYTSMQRSFGNSDLECEVNAGAGGTSCPCSSDADVEAKFPYISISFESVSTSRFLGLDSGDDVVVCVPPAAYVRYNAKTQHCEVAIAPIQDVSSTGSRFLTSRTRQEALVLGLPFFRSVEVLLDRETSRVGIGAPLSMEAGEAVSGMRRRLSSGDGAECPCADPKNWWSTGHRLSWRRVVVVLLLVSALTAYVFVGHSESPVAVYLRNQGERLCGGGHALGGGQHLQANNYPGAPDGRPDRHFIEMPHRRGPE